MDVTVYDHSYNTLSGVTVVLGDSNGVMKAYGTTDVNGHIAFTDSPANATVTAATSCLYPGATTTTYSLDVRYDVNEAVELYLDGCSSSSETSSSGTALFSPLGTLTVNVTNTINGVTGNQIFINYESVTPLYETSLITQETFTVYQYELQSDGKLSVFVTGQDAAGKSIAYGAVLDQTFTDGMTVDITVDKPMEFVQYQITNIPSTTTSLAASINLYRTGKGGIQLGDWYTLACAPSSTVLNVSYIPGFADAFMYALSAGPDPYSFGDGTIYPWQNLILSELTGTPSNQSFDLNEALKPPANLAVNRANMSTPTLSWTGLDPRATNMSVGAEVLLPSRSVFLFLNDLSPERTQITYPQLPDSLAAFRPVGVDYFSVDSYGFAGELYRISGASYFENRALAASRNKAFLKKYLPSIPLPNCIR